MAHKKLFELSLYSEFDYPALIGGLVSRYAAEAVGIQADEQKSLGHVVELTYQFLLQNGIWYHEKPEIQCALYWAEGELLIKFSDKARPWQEDQLGRNLAADVGVDKTNDIWIAALNLGLKGRQLHLTIPTDGDYLPVVESLRDQESKQTDIAYRLLRPEEAHEMVNCMYTAYGYTYGVPDVYSHDETSVLMEQGQIVILAAEADDGEIAGVSTLRKRGPASKIYDLCQTAVKPGYKGKRIFENLLRGVLDVADTTLEAQGSSATIPNRHLVSQDRLETAGYVPVGIYLGIVEAKFLPAQIGPFAQERESFLSVYKPFREPEFGPLYIPIHHQAILTRLCEETGIESPIYPVEQTLAGRGRSRIRSAGIDNMKAGVIEIESAGDDIADLVFDKLSAFKQQQFCSIRLFLDLNDPIAIACCERLEAMGFFFAGFFPDEKPWLVLQYLNNVPVLFDELLYPFPGAKYIQYHIERAYRQVQLREKGEFQAAERALSGPTLPQTQERVPTQPTVKNRLSG